MPSAFERLHKTVQNALWDMRWTQLYGFQVESINMWCDTNRNILLMANTASGKTEAAFLPVISSLAEDEGRGSIRVLYIGPLKALINDQFQRLEELCERSHIPVHRWHGDVGSHLKKRLINKPSGILLITPESLESLLMREGRKGIILFRKLEAVVVDELHVFLDSERGRQLASQLNRIDVIRETLPRVRRIGLSATIGDVTAAQKWLHREDPEDVALIQSQKSNDVELLLKTYVHDVNETGSVGGGSPEDAPDNEDGHKESTGLLLQNVADHILSHLSGKTNLIFCNSKVEIELLADILKRTSTKNKLPDTFLVHHGSLSRDIRHDAEHELKSNRPCTAICSNTLELGIDIGDVDAVGQVNPPSSVNSLKQRIGRSGRKEGRASKLYMYVPLIKCSPDSTLPEQLYPKLVQAIALVELMIGTDGQDSWHEPPLSTCLDYSTLVQQMLSVIVERGEVNARELYSLLCETEIFGTVCHDEFIRLLRSLGEHDLIDQTSRGDLILGLNGERITANYEFYAAFESPRTYEVYAKGGSIGTVDVIEGYYQPGSYMLLAGKRWKIIDIGETKRSIFVEKARGKKLVYWRGGGGQIHPRVRQAMFTLLHREEIPRWLETSTETVLRWARDVFTKFGLRGRRIVKQGDMIHIFTWTGSRANNTLMFAFLNHGLSFGEIANNETAFTILKSGFTADDVVAVLRQFVSSPPAPRELCSQVFDSAVPPVGKYGEYLPRELLAKAYGTKFMDVGEAVDAASLILVNST